MGFDPENPADIEKLNQQIDNSEAMLTPFREEMVKQKAETAAHHYGDAGLTDRRPIPIMTLAQRIYKRFLTSRNPQALVDVRARELMPVRYVFERALNYQLEKCNIGQAVSDACVDAIYRMGSVTVGTNADNELFVEHILFEDRILDMNARKSRERQFTGHRFLVDKEEAIENSDYEPRARKNLKDQNTDEQERSLRESEDSHSITGQRKSNGNSLFDEIELRQIYIPRKRLLLILGPSDMLTPLKIVEDWEGPDEENGPYCDIGFNMLTGNPMPLGLMSAIFDLHVLANNLFNKVGRQAEDAKTNPIVNVAARAEGEAYKNVPDGHILYSSDPKNFTQLKTGGVDQGTLAMVMWSKQMAMMIGGNLESLGGLSTQSSTYGQDRLLSQAANETIADIQQDSIDFVSKVIRQFAWHLWNDPLVDVEIFEPIKGTTIVDRFEFNRETREGEFFDYDIRFNAYSLGNQSPQERASQAMGMLRELVIPLAPVMQQSGMSVDWEYVFKLLSRYANNPDLDAILRYADGEQIAPPEALGTHMPAATTRRYVRENRGQSSQSQMERGMMQSLLSGGSNTPESEALGAT